jgi:hypothetical protein
MSCVILGIDALEYRGLRRWSLRKASRILSSVLNLKKLMDQKSLPFLRSLTLLVTGSAESTQTSTQAEGQSGQLSAPQFGLGG